MKYMIIFNFLFLFLAACSYTGTKSSLTGTYVSYHEHEFGKTDDTLTVVKPNSGEGIYQIERHAGTVRTEDGKKFPKKVTTETWTVEYDPVKQTLFELKEGRTLIWNSGTQTLRWGNTDFRKIAK